MNDLKDIETDIELEQRLAEFSEEERALLLEDHRQLEKDLLRLSDPLPPPDFVNQVMTRVAHAPARAPAKPDILLALIITLSSFAAGISNLISVAGYHGVGLAVANAMVRTREISIGLLNGMQALWMTAALPVAVALALIVAASLLALRRMGTFAKAVS
jgi:hypothetical protein